MMAKVGSAARTRPETFRVTGPAGDIAVFAQGDPAGEPVLMTHSILSSSMMWDDEAALLAARGWRVIRADTRGHGQSQAPAGPYGMDALAADSIAVLDALDIERVHYVGLSLGGMSGFGLGIRYSTRMASLCLCDARADTPPALQPAWAERIAQAREQGTAALADATIERWFGKSFVAAHPEIADRFRRQAAATPAAGFIGCAQAIQGLDYLAGVEAIAAPTTLVVGANDGSLPEAMAHLRPLIAGAVLEVIPGAGHLPNIDQPAAFQEALLRHLARARPDTTHG
ncbi:alpha/beta hydrolase [Pigmentiphaga sp.]|uniref:alpha/beta fold hydrolase n=1 Tax=Pigmentiphaga sp. TaxID=1977564 RepID=UPI0025E755CD|nr:alpha/beta hydrolase [Pigmentiphaga sp.]